MISLRPKTPGFKTHSLRRTLIRSKASRPERPVSLVTGASRGIGRAIATQLAQTTGPVAINFKCNEAAARAVAEEIKANGGVAEIFRADVGEADVASPLLDAVTKAFGSPVSILVNNAGITCDRRLTRMSTEDFTGVIATNLVGAFQFTRAVLPGMISTGWGRIIFVSSIMARWGGVFQANYAASKAGLLGFMRATAIEHGRSGITVNTVLPGFTETDMTRGEKIPRDKIFAHTPMGRFAQPEEVAAAVTFLASERAGFITGAEIPVDGGLSLGTLA